MIPKIVELAKKFADKYGKVDALGGPTSPEEKIKAAAHSCAPSGDTRLALLDYSRKIANQEKRIAAMEAALGNLKIDVNEKKIVDALLGNEKAAKCFVEEIARIGATNLETYLKEVETKYAALEGKLGNVYAELETFKKSAGTAPKPETDDEELKQVLDEYVAKLTNNVTKAWEAKKAAEAKKKRAEIEKVVEDALVPKTKKKK